MICTKILVLVDWFYPGYKAGGPIQSCRNFVAAMGDEYELFILTSDRDLGDQVPYAGIETGAWLPYGQNAKVYYSPVEQINARFIEELVHELGPDFLYLNSMYSYKFTILPLWLAYRNKITAKIILAPRGMLQAGAMQFSTAKKKLFISLINLTGMPKRIRFHATDEQERQDILQFFPGSCAVEVATNFPAAVAAEFSPPVKEPQSLRIAYISRLAPKKNVHFLLERLALLPASIHCELSLRGEFETDAYRNQCETIVKKMPAHIKVNFGGAIRNDLIPEFLRNYHIFALPTQGENFGHAIFEALGAGRPVLISDRTPWRKLGEKKAGWDLALEDPAAFDKVFTAVAAMDQERLSEWCIGAWYLAKDFVAGTNIKEQYRKLFN